MKTRILPDIAKTLRWLHNVQWRHLYSFERAQSWCKMVNPAYASSNTTMIKHFYQLYSVKTKLTIKWIFFLKKKPDK